MIQKYIESKKVCDMREKLKRIEDERTTFIGVFERYGTKTNWNGYPENTILLKEIKNSFGKIISDHIWFSFTKGFQKLGKLENGDIIQFQARVKPYVKGYVNHSDYIDEREIDYKLNNPTKIQKIGKIDESI